MPLITKRVFCRFTHKSPLEADLLMEQLDRRGYTLTRLNGSKPELGCYDFEVDPLGFQHVIFAEASQ